jgi:general secretion pathway protein C
LTREAFGMIGLLVAFLTATPPPDLTLVGIVLARPVERSTAVVSSGGRTRVVGRGDTAFGGRVESVQDGSIVLVYGDDRIEVRLSAAAAGATPVPLRSIARKGSADAPTGRVMVRAEVERRLSQEIPRILAETTILPASEPGGQTAGYTLTRIPENSLLSDAGLMPGDVLTEVNGVRIDSIATLASLYTRLQGESLIRAVVLRDGRPVTVAVTLR